MLMHFRVKELMHQVVIYHQIVVTVYSHDWPSIQLNAYKLTSFNLLEKKI